MDQSTAKRQFVYYLRKADDLSDFQEISEGLDHDEVVDPSEELDRLSEWLWSCHDVIDAPTSALDAIGLESGATYHQAAWQRSVSRILEFEALEGKAATDALYPAFQRYEQGYGRPGDHATFRQWLRDNIADGEELAQADETP